MSNKPSEWMKYSGLGIQMVVSMLVFLYLGKWLGSKLGSETIGSLVGVFFGLFGSIYGLIKEINNSWFFYEILNFFICNFSDGFEFNIKFLAWISIWFFGIFYNKYV